jgi:hypothetical protein
MSFDRREQLLAQLVQIALNIDGIRTVERNKDQIPAQRRPAIVILDAHEEGIEGQFGLGRPLASPGIMHLNPEVYIMSGGASATLGSDLNAFRLLLLPAVLYDPLLIQLCGTSGGIQYTGCITDLARGGTMEGQMALTFSLHYPLLQADF